MQRVHFIHIPKTGGTALKSALSSSPDRERFVFHDHLITLADVPAGEGLFFGIRDPIQRFVSGFNSRMKKGMPRYFYDWSPIQKAGFEQFKTPNEMAEALSSPQLELRHMANALIRDILLTGIPLSYWLISEEYIKMREAEIVCILFQPEMDRDFEMLKSKLQLPSGLSLPNDATLAHRGSENAPTLLTDKARFNLATWYAGDYPLFRAALAARARVNELGAR